MGLETICDACRARLGTTPGCRSCRRALAHATPPDRRHPARQRTQTDGQRSTDPSLTTADCAARLGVGTAFIIGEIRDGRLSAQVIKRPGVRTVYRISPAALEAYIDRYGWSAGRAKAQDRSKSTGDADSVDDSERSERADDTHR